MKRCAALLGLVLSVASAQAAHDYPTRFETAWRLVEERYWDPSYGGTDWAAVRKEYEPRALRASSDRAFYRVLSNMYNELGDSHSVFVPPNRVEEIRSSYGDLPCLGVFAQRGSERVGSVLFEMMDKVGYLRVPDLATIGVSSSVRRAVRNLARRGATELVLDLRGNPGGRLIEMMQTAGVFTGGFLWRTVTRWTLPLPYPALGRVETELPLAVLIDGKVNSAAEGLAGALQSKGRAIVFGERSAGNVEAVLPFCLRDGSQAWIATGVLAPLRGATWEGRGVEPDVETSAKGALVAALEFFERDR